MAAEKSPAFQFYPKDFLTDSHVVAMTLTELGAYIKLLCLCWLDGSVPIDLAALARLCRVSTTAFARLWPALEPCFTVLDGRLVQPRIERERRKQTAYRAMKAAAGQKGGRALAEAKQTGSRNQAEGVADSSPPSSSSSSSSSPDEERTARAARFEAFWAAYPRKVGKDAARKAWEKRQPDDALAQAMLDALAVQIAWPQWVKDGGQFIPHPATWLNQGRWQDEVPQTTKPSRRGPDQWAGNSWLVRREGACPHEPKCETMKACGVKLVSQPQSVERRENP